MGKLALVRPESAPEPYSLIAVYKDPDKDRVVSDRRRRNAREHHLHGASRLLVQPASLADLEASPWAFGPGLFRLYRGYVPGL